MNASLEDFKRESWKLHPVLTMPEGFPPAVMFTLLDSDPRSKYSENLKRRSDVEILLQTDIKSPMTLQLLHETMLISAWDAAFHDVLGDTVALLFNGKGPHSGSGPGDTGIAISVEISSNAPSGPKWLVTRATWFEGKAVCWCLPVKVQQGQKTHVQLTLQNMVTLDMNLPNSLSGEALSSPPPFIGSTCDRRSQGRFRSKSGHCRA